MIEEPANDYGNSSNRRILVTCAESRNSVAASSCLTAADYEIEGVSSRNTRAGGQTRRSFSNIRSCPDPWDHFEDFKSWIQKASEQDGRRWVLPINEAAIVAAMEVRRTSADPSKFILSGDRHLEYALSKFRATEVARRIGLAIPNTRFLRPPNGSELSCDFENFVFPLIIKWDNYCEEKKYCRGSNLVARDRSHAEDVLSELDPSSCGVMAQELVPGHGVGAFFLRHQGKIVLRFAHCRLHEVPWPGGVSAYCESSDDTEVLNAGERLLAAIDYEGVAMVEFRKEPGKPPVFLEINGRLWGSLGLALAAGADFPRAMVECHFHGKTAVVQPDLSQRVRWHDPGLQMDYLRSLWTKAPGPIDGPPPRWRGSLRVLGCFLDPRVQSDWLQWHDPIGTLKRYARLWRRELAWLKAQVLRYLKPEAPHPLIGEAAERTRRWQANPRRAKHILFLCYGNICRSPYAEARWNSLRGEDVTLPVAGSTGFHDKIERKTPARFQSAARHRGVDLVAHRSAKATAEQLSRADLIFAMDLRNLKDVERAFPAMLEKTLLLGCMCDAGDPEIPDPYGQQMGAGGEAYRRIDAELERLRELVRRSE